MSESPGQPTGTARRCCCDTPTPFTSPSPFGSVVLVEKSYPYPYP